MELFDVKGCLSEEGLQALVGGQLDETQRLEAAEHLAYCDRCLPASPVRGRCIRAI